MTKRPNFGIWSLAGIIFLGLFVVTGCEQDTLTPNSADADITLRNPVIHHASVGGADFCEALGLPTGCDANFSLTANMKADGSVSGQWHDQFSGGEGLHVSIDCMVVFDNAAVVGGVITKGLIDGVDYAGQRAVTALVDNSNNNNPPDQISASFLFSGDCTVLTPDLFPLFELSQGQVKVW